MTFTLKSFILSIMFLWGVVAMTWGFTSHRGDYKAADRAEAAVLVGGIFALLPLLVLVF